ncbi:MAG: hypothetical protein LC804_26540, partial [Acidobacteria bacterium]|nr:hypothetical protein [Acidobacteriota bacterium]
MAFLRALQLDPNHVNSMVNLSVLETELGRYDESLIWATRGLRLGPNVLNSHYHVGVPLVALGDHDVSSQWLAGAQRRFPEYVRMEILLSMAGSVRGNNHSALA